MPTGAAAALTPEPRYAYPLVDALVRAVAVALALEGWRVLDWDLDHGVEMHLLDDLRDMFR